MTIPAGYAEVTPRQRMEPPEAYTVSVIMPARRTEKYIEKALKSIYDQSWLPKAGWEMLVGVDDCPGTLRELESMSLPNTRVFYFDVNVGPYIIRNTLVEKTKYDNILFFDSDDTACPDLIKAAASTRAAGPVRFRYMDHSDTCAHGIFHVSKAVFSELGGFQPWLCAADTEFHRRAAYHGIMGTPILDRAYFRRSRRPDSLTNDKTTGMDSSYRNALRDQMALTIRDKRIEPVTAPCRKILPA